MAYTRTLKLQQISSAGIDRVTCTFITENNGVGALTGQPTIQESFNLNLSQNEAAALRVNAFYPLTLGDEIQPD